MMSVVRMAVVSLVCALGASAQYPADGVVTRVLQDSRYQAATGSFDTDYPRFVRDIIALTEIPAPPFKEDARAAAFAALMRDTQPTSVERDAEGNILALRQGTDPMAPVVVFAAHLDTVFPEGTDVTVRRAGTRLSAPGIGDNAQGVAMLVALSRAMQAAGVRTKNSILFVGNVGEEGTGDLRGMKHLFTKGAYRNRVGTFVSIDGVGRGDFITTGGVGSRRYRVTFRGPGGHSYGAFGLVNPANAIAMAIQKLSAIRVPASPKTTFNVGTIGGGTSVNTIPSSAWMDVDLRSESAAELEKLDEAFETAVAEAVAAENQVRSVEQGRITVSVDLLGARPSGQTPDTSRLVQVADAAARAMGLSPTLGSSSTDANLPMSLGIPAITIDSGLGGGRPHAPDEWIDVDRGRAVSGFHRVLLLLLALADLQ